MTTRNMSEQTRIQVSKAISRFVSAFSRLSSFSNEMPGIESVASFLYMMKEDYITIRTNITNSDNYVISLMDLAYWEKIGKKQKGIYNQALVVDFPEDDPMVEGISKNISLLKMISKVNPSFVFDFFESISKYKENDLYYLQVLDIALEIFSSMSYAGQFSQPVEFAELASALIDVKDKDIYNPFSGMMSFATSMKGYCSFTGVELNHTIAEIGKYRMLLAGMQDNVNCIQGDVSDWTKQVYDVIVSTPPIGKSISTIDENGFIRSEWFCLKNFETLTNEGGALFTYVVPSVVFDVSKLREFRRDLTEKNYLDTVISLPANLLQPYTSVSLVAIILRKNRRKDDPIKMLDAKDFNKGSKKEPVLDVDAVVNCLNNPISDKFILVKQEDIRQSDYNWSVEKYLYSNRESFPEGFQVISLREIVDIIRGERQFEEKNGRLAKIADLAPEAEDCVRTVDSFDLSKDLSNATKITEPVILLSTIRILKPTYCEASPSNPIFLHPHIIACKIKREWVSPTYLCLELSRRYVQTGGSVIPHISRPELLGMKIAFPSIGNPRSLEEQNNLYKEATNNARLAKAKELGLQSLIESMKADYINVIRARKHDMRPYVRELGAFERIMRQYISKVDTSDIASKMNILLNQHQIALNKLRELIDVFSEEQQFGEPEQFNINRYFVELEFNHDKSTGYWIKYDRDDYTIEEYGISVPNAILFDENLVPVDSNSNISTELMEEENKFPLMVDINHLDFERLVRNIIDNAVTHGFTDPNRNDYGICIDLTIDSEKRMFQIDFSNNGKPLPLGMDRLRYGILGEKAGTTGNTGRGGYIVKSIVEHYHGDYDVFMDGMNTVVRILLPISEYNYQYEQGFDEQI